MVLTDRCSRNTCSPATVALVTLAPLTFSLLHTLHMVPKNQKPMRKTLKLDKNLTLIFFSNGHSSPPPSFFFPTGHCLRPNPQHQVSQCTRTAIRRASVTGASLRGATVIREQVSGEHHLCYRQQSHRKERATLIIEVERRPVESRDLFQILLCSILMLENVFR